MNTADLFLLQAQALAEDFAVSESEWLSVHRLEAEVERYFDTLVAELPEPVQAYGAGFGLYPADGVGR